MEEEEKDDTAGGCHKGDQAQCNHTIEGGLV